MGHGDSTCAGPRKSPSPFLCGKPKHRTDKPFGEGFRAACRRVGDLWSDGDGVARSASMDACFEDAAVSAGTTDVAAASANSTTTRRSSRRELPDTDRSRRGSLAEKTEPTRASPSGSPCECSLPTLRSPSRDCDPPRADPRSLVSHDAAARVSSTRAMHEARAALPFVMVLLAHSVVGCRKTSRVDRRRAAIRGGQPARPTRNDDVTSATARFGSCGHARGRRSPRSFGSCPQWGQQRARDLTRIRKWGS